MVYLFIMGFLRRLTQRLIIQTTCITVSVRRDMLPFLLLSVGRKLAVIVFSINNYLTAVFYYYITIRN